MASTQGLPVAQQPATGEATPIARIISDVIPPKIPGAPAAGVTPSTSSSSASPSTSSADPLQKLPPQPPSLRHPPPALAAHHRIMALNDQWKRGQVGAAPAPAQEKVPGIDAESSSSDEDEADSDDESDEDAEDESVHDSSDGPARPMPSSQTPVPLPSYTRGVVPSTAPVSASRVKPPPDAGQATSKPQAPASLSPAIPSPKPAMPSGSQVDDASVRAQALRFTEDAVSMQLQSVRDTSPRSAGSSKDATPASRPPSSSQGMRFASAAELVDRIRKDAETAQPPSAGEDAAWLATNGGDDEGSEWEAGKTSSDQDDDDDLVELDEMPADFNKAPRPRPVPGLEILEARDGRPYNIFQGPDGRKDAARGAIIPTNYQLHPQAPRFICPVRDCRRLLKNLTALGAHFGNLHKKVTFNDNCDGTLTVLGPSRDKSQSGFYSGIVVSQNPLPPDAPPPAEPSQPPWQLQVAKIDRAPIPALPGSSSLPALSTPALRSQDSVGSESSPAATTPTWAALGVSPPPPTIPRRGGARYVIGASGITRPPSPPWETAAGYLAGLLHKDSLVPNRADIKFFNRCVFRRKLPASWIEYHGGTMLAAPFYASAMAYMVGNYVGGRQACKKKKTSTRRLSDMCIRLPGGMPLEAKMAFSKTETCVGCHYYANLHRQRNACDWNPDADRGSSVEHSADAEQQPPPPVVVSTSTNTNTNGQGRKHRLSTAEAALEELPRAKVARTNVSPEMRDSEQQSLDMEDWEFAPGRVVDEESNENIIYSMPFLSSAQPVTVATDVAVNIQVVKPGTKARWASEKAQLRSCMVSQGKVKVRIGTTTAHVGPGGLFVVRPGRECAVENRQYGDAVIFCTTHKSYELVEGED
ncbi:mif2/CENP-C like domain-containing protein [Purpureocillium lilacinum]|uniref:Mif2/CENP-C like domain-containing protein n=1 Tax=Purpureocillium lilacinum TaxID=33203 RepID=A0A179GEJ1_PURLI|nr:mif2/CENP-C like domain-containing protein [Purpureocillium lilacinum]OAQ75783.1 mif2/CENP-C like domain-containing protein [Purpureocillium lilacinum]